MARRPTRSPATRRRGAQAVLAGILAAGPVGCESGTSGGSGDSGGSTGGQASTSSTTTGPVATETGLTTGATTGSGTSAGLDTCVDVPAPGDAVGTVHFGTDDYVEHIVGDLPIVFSAPHGGTLRPDVIASRSCGSNDQDVGSQQYARETADRIEALTGRRPHLVINHLDRIKLDPNRAVDEAACGDPISEIAWAEYHAFIDTANQAVDQQCGFGHYFDIHTNGHPELWIEFAYGLTVGELALDDDALRAAGLEDQTAYRSLLGQRGTDIVELTRGPTSLGGLLEQRGYATVPGPTNADPMGGSFFEAGYSTLRHGSRDGGTIDGSQVETTVSLLLNDATRQQYAADLGDAVVVFMREHYAVALPQP